MTKPVTFSEDGARRIIAATKAVEAGSRDMSPIKFRQVGDDGGMVRLGKTTAPWSKGTLADIEVHEEGTPPGETAASPPEVVADCVNKFADVGEYKWVIVAQAGNGRWYLIAAECSPDDPPA